jgi:hypothetical protein
MRLTVGEVAGMETTVPAPQITGLQPFPHLTDMRLTDGASGKFVEMFIAPNFDFCRLKG